MESDSSVRVIVNLHSLQWSHVLTNVESGQIDDEPESEDWASMEPRPHERGKRCFNANSKQCRNCFNGATSSRTWKVRAATRPKTLWSSFNGATSSRTWKEWHPTLRRWLSVRLQWSHVLTNVESRFRQRLRAALVSFNGATSSRTWKGGQCLQRTDAGKLASMEPRPHERGKSKSRLRDCAGRELQWSHVLTNVERWLDSHTNHRRNRASMEPRPHERGKPQKI